MKTSPLDVASDWYKWGAILSGIAAIGFLLVTFFWSIAKPETFHIFSFTGVVAVLIWAPLIFAIGLGLTTILFIFISVFPWWVTKAFNKKKARNRLTDDEQIKCKIVLACEGLPDIQDEKPYFAVAEWKKMKHREYKIYRSIINYNFAEINCSVLNKSPKEAFYGLISNHKIRGKYRIFSPYITEGNHFKLIDKTAINGIDAIKVIDDTKMIERIISSPYFSKNGFHHYVKSQGKRSNSSQVSKIYY